MMPFEDMDFARIDTHRALRTGRGEVIFSAGKKPEQVAQIMRKMAETAPLIMATRAETAHWRKTEDTLKEGDWLSRNGLVLHWHEAARMIVLKKEGPATKPNGLVAVVSAGTADIPVAEEAALTAEYYGHGVLRVFDVGVAGLHRLLDRIGEIRKADVVIAVAGMEGALASVLGGLVERPVIAVPTSVGYGAYLGGLTALLAMLNSCSLGVGVMNIDNGFGAGHLASMVIGDEGKQTGENT
jgi:NCAIR mutase (PurE)-related protein